VGRAKRTRGETGEDEIEGPLGRGGDRCGLGGTERGPVRKGFLRSHVRNSGGLCLLCPTPCRGDRSKGCCPIRKLALSVFVVWWEPRPRPMLENKLCEL